MITSRCYHKVQRRVNCHYNRHVLHFDIFISNEFILFTFHVFKLEFIVETNTKHKYELFSIDTLQFELYCAQWKSTTVPTTIPLKGTQIFWRLALIQENIKKRFIQTHFNLYSVHHISSWSITQFPVVFRYMIRSNCKRTSSS